MPGLRQGYPGLVSTASGIVQYFPPCKLYVEPFAGLGRTAEFVTETPMVLNDMSDYAVGYLKESFPNAIVTQEDFADCIRKHDGPNTLFFMDPPWSRIDYKDNPKTYCDRGVGDYYGQLRKLLPTIQGNWILAGRALGGARSTVSVYFKDYNSVIIEGNRTINGHRTKVKIVSNTELVPTVVKRCTHCGGMT